MRPFHIEHIPRKLDRSALHSETNAKERYSFFSGKLNGPKFSFDPSHPEPSRHKDPGNPFELLEGPSASNVLGIDLLDHDRRIIGDPAVLQGFINRFVSILQVDVFPDHGDPDRMFRMKRFVDHVFFPFVQASCFVFDFEFLANDLIDLFVFERKRAFIDRSHVTRFDDGFRFHIAEKRDLVFHRLVNLFFRAADQDIGLDTDLAQGPDAMLRGFCFKFPCGTNIRNKR